MKETITIRRVEGLPTLMSWRMEVLKSVFGIEPGPEYDKLYWANRSYYGRAIPAGTHYAVVAEINGRPVGCGAICFHEELPSPENVSGRCAYIMNVYVRPQHRHQGVARHILNHLVEVARRTGCDKIYLETTRQARSLYADAGFRDIDDMMKLYDYETNND